VSKALRDALLCARAVGRAAAVAMRAALLIDRAINRLTLAVTGMGSAMKSVESVCAAGVVPTGLLAAHASTASTASTAGTAGIASTASTTCTASTAAATSTASAAAATTDASTLNWKDGRTHLQLRQRGQLYSAQRHSLVTQGTGGVGEYSTVLCTSTVLVIAQKRIATAHVSAPWK
jgi:hypothetical protein